MNVLQSFGVGDGDIELKARLIGAVKKEVKQLMEEAVTKKYIHEESSSVNSLCAAVEACLCHGLRRRALGLFKTSSTTALIQKIAKTCPEADYVNRRLIQNELVHDNTTVASKRSSSSSDSIIKPKLLSKGSSNSVTMINTVATSGCVSTPVLKHLWIRFALFERCLNKIIEYLVSNSNSFYDRDALVADADYGSILSSLLVGPCALEFTRAKSADTYWSDPHADELIQRHRISTGMRSPPTCHRPVINFKRSLHTSSEDTSSGSIKINSPATVAKDYVESLHQNSKAILLYGKNNVLVLPKDHKEPMPGYLSLHQTVQSLIIKWTPNQLMNGYNDEDNADKISYWNYALNVNVEEIVYVHCHQNRGDDTGGTIILVGQDGVQRAPIHFPEGGHLQSFLSCLETGLLPHGQLDPPLWSQRGMGKVFPWSRSVKKRLLPSVMESTKEVPIDYVFRVVSKSQHEEFLASHPILELGRLSPRRKHLGSCSTTDSSDCSSKSLSIEQTLNEYPVIANKTASIELVCSTMRRQIISRAFYGWLAYCRHLSTVRTHLSGLVFGRITPEFSKMEKGLTKEKWFSLEENGVIRDDIDVYRLVYFGGIDHEIRMVVWPYLLGHYKFGSTTDEREKLDRDSKRYYETTMSEWLAVEAIVQQREKEKNAQALAKMSAESRSKTNVPENPTYSGFQPNGDSDVVSKSSDDENDFSDISDPEETEYKTVEKVLEPIQNRDFDHDGYTTPDLTGVFALSIKTSPSTSSYETVENEFLDNAVVVNNQFLFCNDKLTSASSNYKTENCEVPTFRKYERSRSQSIEISMEDPQLPHAVIITKDTLSDVFQNNDEETNVTSRKGSATSLSTDDIAVPATLDSLKEPKSVCASPASSNGGVYSSELLENFALNLHRIEKDVQRCDRNYWYFANHNLEKLRNVISTYVWEHLDVGYMQGMCDLVAPLLVIFDDESLAYSCFCKLMERMIHNFPNGGAMDMHFANMRSLIQILDSEMYDLMDSNGDYTHFYFCYRWFLLDFKREFVYDDVFTTWEVIWAAKHFASSHFVLFLALALLETYRDIILSNSMDFTDVIKFFNEMAERHNVQAILQLSRNLVLQLQTILENK